MIKELQEHLKQEDDKRSELKKKTSFWASESEAMVFDIYHKWKGTTPTNPPGADTQMIFLAGRMMEEALVQTMDDMESIETPLEDQLRIEIEREGIPISGYLDAITKEGVPIEIKSYYGDYQTRELLSHRPRESYLKQLAIYMDALDKDKGLLIYIERGTGKMFEFELFKEEGLNFRCLDIRFNLENTYKRWSRLYKNNVLKDVEPKCEYRYKIPVHEVKWRELSKSNISKARNNKKIIGDHPWAVNYSSYKDLIIEKEGTELGYTDSELIQIKLHTKNYTKW